MFYVFIVFCIVLSCSAIICTNLLSEKFSKYKNGLNLNGQDFVKMFIKDNDLEQVDIEHNGNDDYFDLEKGTINLSDFTYGKNTVTSIAIAAHECGHVLQAAKSPFLLKFRRIFLIYVTAITYLSAVLISISYLMQIGSLMNVATGLLFISLIFQFFTLPIETDASEKAYKYLKSKGLDKEELAAIRKLLFISSISYFGNLFLNVFKMFKITWGFKKKEIRYNVC